MISPKFFIETLKGKNIDFFTGIPDSLLKYVCAYITDNSSTENNVIASNEGAAMAIAAGYHLATNNIPVVYLQNSGEGNIINPLLSLTDADVFNIPVLLLIGWRGEPGFKDEPQHYKQGKVTLNLLESIGVKYSILLNDEKDVKIQIEQAIAYIQKTKEAYAFIIKKDTFLEYNLTTSNPTNLLLTRELAINIVTKSLNVQDSIVSTTGMISRELYEFRSLERLGHFRDFLTIGSMGYASQIALGIALHKPNRKIFCFDGDGSFIMHMGSLAIIGARAPKNFYHIIFNNGSHDSVGGQPTVGFSINIPKLAKSCGYLNAFMVSSEKELHSILPKFLSLEGPILLEIKVKKGNRKDLGRPTITPKENKEMFMSFLK